MAKFNEKVMCLFHKDYRQLKKESVRRGLVYESREKAIASIIWKDAFDAGVVAGREISPVVVPPRTEDYCLYDTEDDKRYRLTLTKEQVRMIEWLLDTNFIQSVELTRWDDQDYEDIGCI